MATTVEGTEYICGECKRNFESLFSLAEHGNTHTGDRPFACPDCFQTFPLTTEYRNHYNEAHKCLARSDGIAIENEGRKNDSVDFSRPMIVVPEESIEEFSCDQCRKRYSTKKRLIRHKCIINVGNHDRNWKPLLCSCLITFYTLKEFKSHLRPMKPSRYSCCACSMMFSRLTNLKMHIRSHTKDKPFICKLCNRSFAQRTNLKNHLSTHAGEKAAKCKLCTFSCQTPGGLFKHLKKHEMGISAEDQRKVSTQSYECHICARRFKFLRNLGMHMKSHLDTTLLCPVCGKVLPSAGKLQTHVSNSHGESSPCFVCQKRFKGSSAMRSHMRTHRTEKVHECNVCKKCFTLPGYLKCHMRIHDDKLTYRCNVCDRPFRSYQSRKYHYKIGCKGARREELMQPAFLENIPETYDVLATEVDG